MDTLWGVLGALAAIVLPMALAGWLLGRPARRREQPPRAPCATPAPRGNITGKEQG